jgi:hypothetical protein
MPGGRSWTPAAVSSHAGPGWGSMSVSPGNPVEQALELPKQYTCLPPSYSK